MSDDDLIRRGDALAAIQLGDTVTKMQARIRAITPAVTQPAPDAAIREAWERSYWRMRSYAVHDNDCKLNKPPRFDGPCSCGLTAALEEALALLTEGTIRKSQTVTNDWECPIGAEGCHENCGSYGCGN